MNPFRSGESGTVVVPVKVSELVGMPEALALNGMTPLDKERNLVLIAGCRLGAIWRLDVVTRGYEIVIQGALVEPSSDPSLMGLRSEMDGSILRIQRLGYLCCVPIDADGVAAGAVEILQTGLTTADDFILDKAGDAYIAQDAANVLTEVSAKVEVRAPVGGLNDSYLAGATAVQFGRTELDRVVLYVMTKGGQAKSVGGVVAPGKVVAVFTETEAQDEMEMEE